MNRVIFPLSEITKALVTFAGMILGGHVLYGLLTTYWFREHTFVGLGTAAAVIAFASLMEDHIDLGKVSYRTIFQCIWAAALLGMLINTPNQYMYVVKDICKWLSFGYLLAYYAYREIWLRWIKPKVESMISSFLGYQTAT